MASSRVATVEQYLAELPEDRRSLVGAIHGVVKANLPEGYQEAMQYGMIGWCVPHSLYPGGYHADPTQPLPLASLASQKQYVSLYLMGLYCGAPATGGSSDSEDIAWFREAWLATGRKLNMGKSCVRVKKLDDVALDVIGEAIRRLPVAKYIARYDSIRPTTPNKHRH